MTIVYTVQGFNFHQPDLGFFLLDSSLFAPAVNPRRVDLQIPKMHGEIPLWDDELQPQKLTLRVRIQDKNDDQLQAKWEHLRALMWTGSNRGLTIRRESGSQVTSTFGQLESMSEPDFWCASGLIQVTILFNIPSGRWQSIQEFQESLAPNNSGQQLTFVNESTAPNTDMLIRYQGSFTDTAWVQFIDHTSQTGFYLEPGVAVPAGDYVLVDPGGFKAWHNTSGGWDERDTDISGGLRSLNSGMLSLVSIPSFQIGVRTSDLQTTRSTGTDIESLDVRGRRTYI